MKRNINAFMYINILVFDYSINVPFVSIICTLYTIIDHRTERNGAFRSSKTLERLALGPGTDSRIHPARRYDSGSHSMARKYSVLKVLEKQEHSHNNPLSYLYSYTLFS